MAFFDRPKVVLCTSSSGSGRDDYLEEFESVLSQRQRAHVHTYSLRDEMLKLFDAAGVRTGVRNILDLDDATRGRYRAQAINTIRAKWQNPDCYIVSTPHPIMWRGGEKDGLSIEDVHNLNPDMFVTIVDDVLRTRVMLQADKQFEGQSFSLKEIAQWRGAAINSARQFSTVAQAQRPFYLIPRDHPPEVLRDLIFAPKKGRAYFSFPITNASKKDIRQAKRFVQELRRKYIVFDPLTIQDHVIISASSSSEALKRHTMAATIQYRKGKLKFTCQVKEVRNAEEALDTQVVERDERLIDQSEVVIVYYPVKAFSAGVIYEMFYGKKLVSKHVYAWHPYRPSPFFKYLCDDRKVFSNFEQFRRVLMSTKVCRAAISSWGEKV